MVNQSKIDKIEKIPETEVTILRRGGQSATINRGDRVFVKRPGKKWDKIYLKGLVLEIRANTVEAWFRINYYHTADDPPPDNLRSPTELNLSNVIKWTSGDEIEDNMREFFKAFDDSKPDPPRINSKTWFHRETLTPCPACEQPYHPHIDRQRYCVVCVKWLHIGCMGEEVQYPDFDIPPNQGILDTESLGDDGLPSILKEVLSRPTVRGHGGEFTFEDCWLNTGSGVQKAMIEKWKVDGTVPGDWLKQLGENFLEEFVIGKTWKRYPCILCSSQI